MAISNTNVVLGTAQQSLNAGQKEQVLTNIGAVSQAELATAQDNILGILSDAILFRTYTYTTSSISSSSSYVITESEFGITDIEGYTRVAVVGYYADSAGTAITAVAPVEMEMQRTTSDIVTGVMRIRNLATSSGTRTVSMTIMFVKDELLEPEEESEEEPEETT